MSVDVLNVSIPYLLRRWFSFLGGGLAWTFHLLAIYVIGEFGCVSGFDQIHYAGLSAVAWMLLIVSVMAVAPAMLATYMGYVDTRHDARQAEQSPYGEGDRYLSKFGWPLNAIFTLIIIVESLPVFAYLDGC